MAIVSEFSRKYKNILTKSVVIRSGPPVVFQLKPKKEEFGTLTRMTVGEKNPNKPRKTILVVGETGAGKSSLINALINYTMGVTWEEEAWFHIVEDEKRSQSQSQTSDVIVYEICGFEGKPLPYSLTIIDTPGYGDTRGFTEDDKISQRLFDLFRSEDGVHEINAVGLVMKASENRVSDRLRYIFDSVISLFGKDLERNIVILITHSDGRKPKNALQALQAAKIKGAKNEKNEPVYFLFDNCQDEERTKEEEEELKHAAMISERGMGEFTAYLRNIEDKKMTETVDVINERIRLKACIQNLQERITLTELKQKEIKQIQEALDTHKEELENNKDFNIVIDEPYKTQSSISGGMWGLFFYDGATCCKVCEENCHYPGCTLAWYPSDCEVMKNGRCTVCTRKCSVERHVKDKWIYETATRKITRTNAEMKKKYEKNKTESEKKFSLKEHLERDMKQLKLEKSKLLDESYQHIIKLEQIALKADSLSTVVHLDFLIEKMKEIKEREKVQKLEEMRSRVDEGTRAGLRYRTGKAN